MKKPAALLLALLALAAAHGAAAGREMLQYTNIAAEAAARARTPRPAALEGRHSCPQCAF